MLKKAFYLTLIVFFVTGCGKKFAKYYNDRGTAHYREKNDLESAILEYTKAIEVDPNYEVAYYNRAHLYEELGEYNKAIDDYDDLIKILIEKDIIFDDYYVCKAKVYFKIGEYDKCWENIHEAEKLDWEGNPEFIEKLKKASGKDK